MEHGRSFNHRIHRMLPTLRVKTTVHPRLKAFTDATAPFRPSNEAPYDHHHHAITYCWEGRWKSHTGGPTIPSKPGISVARKLETPPPNPSTHGTAIAPPLSNDAAYGPLNKVQSANTEGGRKGVIEYRKGDGLWRNKHGCIHVCRELKD